MIVTIGNSISKATELTAEQFTALRQLLSYVPTAAESHFAGRGYQQRKYLLHKSGTFPTGLLYLVGEKFPKAKYVDTRIAPRRLEGLFKADMAHTPYGEQDAAARAAHKLHRGIIVAPTGVGKSLIAALIVEALQVPTLVVVTTLELKRQLRESLSQIFGADKVGGLGSPLAVENIAALDPKKPLKGYGCVIIDEFHHSGAKSYRNLNVKAWADVYYRIGLTATPFRANASERLLLESVLSAVIYRVEYKAAVSMGRIVPLEAYYRDIPRTNTDSITWGGVYSDLVVKNEIRNGIIAMDLAALTQQGVPTLCLVKEVAHGEKLSQATGVPFAHGQAENCQQLIKDFNAGRITSLIGTTGVLGEGVDTKPCEWVLMAQLGKSKNAFMQAVGRGFRRCGAKESCKIMLYKDLSHKWPAQHFRAQVKYLKEEYGIKPARID